MEGALSAEIAGVKERGYFGIYYKSRTYKKTLCAECRGFESQGTGTEDSYELGGALSCQRKLTREWGREEGRWEVGGGKVWMKVTKRDGGRIMRECTDEDVPKGTVRGA